MGLAELRRFLGIFAVFLCLSTAACGGEGSGGPDGTGGDGGATVAPPACGDGTCTATEDRASCPDDCTCPCGAGTVCASPTSDDCVCDELADGLCPAGCSGDPDCVTACVPACDGKQCGPDGCGGSCGSCGSGTTCEDAICAPHDPRCGGLDPTVCNTLSWSSCASDWAWRTPFAQVGGALFSLEASNERIWLTGDFAFLAFHDGKYLHKVENPAGAASLADIWRSPEGRWWAVGASGKIFLGDGECWAAVPSPVTDHLHAVWGAADDEVWAVGANGTVLKFDGTRWAKVSLPGAVRSTSSLRDVWGNGSDVWAVGDANAILHFDGARWERHEPLYSHDFHRVFVRSPADVWVLARSGWWSRWNGTEWNTELRPELLLDMWGTGQDVWRTWAHSGSGTGGLEHSNNGGATYTPVGGISRLVYSPRLAFGDELWSLMPGSGSQTTTELVRVVGDQAAEIGAPILRAMREITVLHRLPSGSTIATNYDTLFTHDGTTWSSATLPTELHGRQFRYAAVRGDEIWLANGQRPGGPNLAHFANGAWSHVSLSGLAFEVTGLGCTAAGCFAAIHSGGVLRHDGSSWVADTLPGLPEGGVAIAMAASAADVWVGVNQSGAASLYRRDAGGWVQVAAGLGPIEGMAFADGRLWVLDMRGRLYTGSGGTMTPVGDLPRTIAGVTMQWRDLRVEGGIVHALADKVVCTTSSTPGPSLTYECLANPFTSGFSRLGTGPNGLWALAGSAGFLELR